ncbi:hypothetical protein Tco_0013707 [Tanacetum coccineum]
MDVPTISTMEEYIRLEEEKAQRHGRTFNWQTAKFKKVKNYEDEDDCFIDFETEFPAIVFDNILTSDAALLCAPTVLSIPFQNMIGFRNIFRSIRSMNDYSGLCLDISQRHSASVLSGESAGCSRVLWGV